MNEMYDFLTGPGLWLAFAVFLGGLIIRVARLAAISREKDKPFYETFNLKWALKSIFFWLVPFGSRSFRRQPLFAAAFWLFHICLFATPLFLEAHNVLWDEAWGVSLPALSDDVTDWMTIVFLVSAAVLRLRRLIRPEVRILTGAWDYIVLLLTAAPFVTGFMAFNEIGNYDLMMLLHVLFGEIMLVVIPFSKLGHMLLFFFTRAYIGMEMGARREMDGRLGGRVW